MHFTLNDWIFAYYKFSGVGRQVNIDRAVYTGEKFIRGVSFSAVLLKPAIKIVGFLVISDQYQWHRRKMLSSVSLTRVINCSPVWKTTMINFLLPINCRDDRGLFFLQNCETCGKNKDATVRRQRILPPQGSEAAADDIIETAIKSHIHGTAHTRIRGPWGRLTSSNYNGDISALCPELLEWHLVRTAISPATEVS